MNFVVPADMQIAIKEKVNTYMDCLQNGRELPKVNLKQLQDQYTSLLSIRLRKSVPTTVAKRAAKNIMDAYFEGIMNSLS
jgi:hypothetical protein